jgi:hypothetical protein
VPRYVITGIGRALYRADACPFTHKQCLVLGLLNTAAEVGDPTGWSVEALALWVKEPVAAVERILSDLIVMRAVWPAVPT